MTNAERVGIWFLMAALVGMAFIWWAALNKRIDEESTRLSAALASPATTSTTTSPNPLAADLLGLKQQVDELQANRGLTGPEVRELVETLMPAPNNPPTDETCSAPPCVGPNPVTPTTRPGGPVTVGPASTTTTEKKRRRPR